MVRIPVAIATCFVVLLPAALAAAESTCAELLRATQALMDATAPGERSVWEHYTDTDFLYVAEDNEVNRRAEVLEDLEPLPPGSTGWLTVEDFRCHDYREFAVTRYLIYEHETVEGHELHARYRQSDTWWRRQRWASVNRCVASQQDSRALWLA